MKGVKDWAIECLKRPETGRPEGGERKGMTLRVVELSSIFGRFPRHGDGGLLKFYLGPVKVEEYEVSAADGDVP